MKENKSVVISLAGQVALVTGAASGIGKGTARRLAQCGALVMLLDINEEQGRQAAAELQADGLQVKFYRCDVRSADNCRQVVAEVIAGFGRIDILFNNAGVAIRKDIVELQEEEWDLALDVMLKGIFQLSRQALPHMIRARGGCIVNTGSGWSLKGGPKAVSYCAAKGGVLNITRAMAIDYGKYNIRVNCVCPGDIDTPMLRGECAQLHEDETKFMAEAANRPLQRVGTVDDVANAVLFFVSDLASWVTGTHLVVDGGGIA